MQTVKVIWQYGNITIACMFRGLCGNFEPIENDLIKVEGRKL